MKLIKKITIFFLLSLLFFGPRYFAHLQYEALEDEILAISNNIANTPAQLVFAPDYTHPQFWYLLMDYPTKIFGITHGILPYRLIQITSLFILLVITYSIFKKHFDKKFFIIFASLFTSNIYLAHLTSQHRMYSIILGLSIFYSLAWLVILRKVEKKEINKNKNFIFLGILATVMFLTNYSAIWIIPIWPLTFFLQSFNKNKLKQLLIFTTTFLISISWFIPTFIKNSTTSIENNQWAPLLNVRSAIQVFGNYFGIIPKFEHTSDINLVLLPFLFLIAVLIFTKIKLGEPKKYFITLVVSTFISFSMFLLTVYLSNKSLLYPRPSITIIVACYIFITLAAIKNRYGKLIICLLVFLQLTQWPIYIFPEKNLEQNYDLWNYRKNPLSYFKNYQFPKQGCLLTLPPWNTLSVQFFLDKNVRIIDSNLILEKNKKLSDLDTGCNEIYVLDQTPVNRDIIKGYYQEVFGELATFELVDKHDNQNLYKLN